VQEDDSSVLQDDRPLKFFSDKDLLTVETPSVKDELPTFDGLAGICYHSP